METPIIRRSRPEVTQAREPYEMRPLAEVEGVFTEIYSNWPRYKENTSRGGGHVTREATCPHGPVEESSWLPSQEPFIQRSRFLLNKLLNGSVIEHDLINHKDVETRIPTFSEQIVSDYLSLPLPYRENESAFGQSVTMATYERYSWFAYYYPNLTPALRAFLHVAGAAGTEVADVKTQQYLRHHSQEADRHYERMCKVDMAPEAFIGKHMTDHSFNVRCGGEMIAASLIRGSHEAAVIIRKLMDEGVIPAYETANPMTIYLDPTVNKISTLDLQFLLVHSLDHMIRIMAQMPTGHRYGIPAREWIVPYLGIENYNPVPAGNKYREKLKALLSGKFLSGFKNFL